MPDWMRGSRFERDAFQVPVEDCQFPVMAGGVPVVAAYSFVIAAPSAATASHEKFMTFPSAASENLGPRRNVARRLWFVLVVIHRYLGVVLGLLMLAWFISGIVMMYVPYPQRGETERTSALASIPWSRCCNFAGVPLAGGNLIEAAQVENVADQPVLRLRSDGKQIIAGLTAGQVLAIGDAEAKRIAEISAERIIGSVPAILSAEKIENDQWTVGDNSVGRRPLYRFSFDDPDATRLYISSITGEVVVWTTRGQRFWNWLGAVPHWLYFTEFRRNGALWVQTIIWTSLLGTFLTVIGLYLGIARFRTGRDGRLSPYYGWFYWHHLTGLFFGIVTLTWVMSGLFSMQPWGFLEGAGGNERQRLAGAYPQWAQVQTSLDAIRGRFTGDVVSVRAAPFGGNLFWLATGEDGRVVRLDERGNPAPITQDDLANATQLLAGERGIESASLLHEEDAYYFRFQGFAERDPLVLPVYRIALNDEERTRYYLDPSTGALLLRVDGAERGYRWLFNGLHRWDFTATLRARPLWDIVVLFLMLGSTAGVLTGVYLGVRRIRLDLGA